MFPFAADQEQTAMTYLRTALVLGLAMLAAGCAQDRENYASDRSTQCFFPSEISGFSHAGNDRIHVHTGPRDVYLFETFGSCRDLNWSEAIGFDQFGAGSICSGLDLTLVVPSPIGPQRCPVRMIRKLSAAEAEAR
jgi:hypothetical protein